LRIPVLTVLYETAVRLVPPIVYQYPGCPAKSCVISFGFVKTLEVVPSSNTSGLCVSTVIVDEKDALPYTSFIVRTRYGISVVLGSVRTYGALRTSISATLVAVLIVPDMAVSSFLAQYKNQPYI